MTQNVKRNTIGRLALGFFAAMLVLTLLNQKIDALRTPHASHQSSAAMAASAIPIRRNVTS